MNNVIGAVNRAMAHRAQQETKQKPQQPGEPKRPPCRVPEEKVDKTWTQWRNMGMGPYSVQYTVTKEGESYAKTCTAAYCVVQNTETDKCSVCPPEWYEYVSDMVNKVNKQ